MTQNLAMAATASNPVKPNFMDAADLESYTRFLPRPRSGFGVHALAAEPEAIQQPESIQNNITGMKRIDTFEMPLGTSALAARISNCFRQCPFKAVEVLCGVLNDVGNDDGTHQLALSVGDKLYGEMYDRGKYDTSMRDAAKILELELINQPQHREKAYKTRNAFSAFSYKQLTSAWSHDISKAAGQVRVDPPSSSWNEVFARASANTANDRPMVKPGNFYVAPSLGLQ